MTPLPEEDREPRPAPVAGTRALQTKIRPNPKAALHAKMREKVLPKKSRGSRARRVIKARYDEETDRLHYYHATRGWRSRKFTPELFAELMA